MAPDTWYVLGTWYPVSLFCSRRPLVPGEYAIQQDQASRTPDGFKHGQRSTEVLLRGLQKRVHFDIGGALVALQKPVRFDIGGAFVAQGDRRRRAHNKMRARIIDTSIRARANDAIITIFQGFKSSNRTAGVEQPRIVVATTTSTAQVRVVLCKSATCDIKTAPDMPRSGEAYVLNACERKKGFFCCICSTLSCHDK